VRPRDPNGARWNVQPNDHPGLTDLGSRPGSRAPAQPCVHAAADAEQLAAHPAPYRGATWRRWSSPSACARCERREVAGRAVGCWPSPGRPEEVPLPEPAPAPVAADLTGQALLGWCQRLPKVELHLHLEGAIPHEALWELVGKYGGGADLGSPAGLAERFRYRDFAHFIDVWTWKNGFLREYDDLTLVAEAVARDLAAQRIRYAEAFFSPGDFAHHNLTVQPLAAAIRAGLDRVAGVEVALVADLVRDTGPKVAAATPEAVAEARELGVVGVGLGGSEQSFPPEPFAPVYERARRLGLRTTVHAGEAAGPASVWGAITALQPERIGHGTRAAEDPALLAHLAATSLPVEACPLSNVATGVVGSLEEHPIRRLVDAGVLVTVNTDDPKMFGNSLAQEFALLRARLGFSADEVRGLLLDAVAASWLPEPRKQELAEEFRSDPAWAASPST
jgi:adenosine deaminase